MNREVLEAFRQLFNLALNIKASTRELSTLTLGLEGGYVEPGPSGSLTRGKLDVLPTGRNFYAVDPSTVPTKPAWEIGVKTANQLLDYHLSKHGSYPESIGFVLWAIDTYKADGEQLAQILYLLGVRPKWNSYGKVEGVEVIPIEELGRPRIDCMVRISGVVRDALMNIVELIDEAVSKVVSLDESPEVNYVRKHVLNYVRSGGDFREATFRVFCAPPGAYGAGVNYAFEASAWRTDEDLAKTWVQWSGYAYGKGVYGAQAHHELLSILKTVELVSRNHMSDEHDPLNCCCYFSYHGGLHNAAKVASGKGVEIVTVDTRDLSNTQVLPTKLEIERVVRSKLLNPRWIEEMKKHGYRGANEFSRKILHLCGWSAVSRVVDNWVYDEIAKTYALDDEMRRWLEKNNPWAFEEMVRRLLESAERGLWKPDEELLEKLRNVYGEIEGLMEDIGDITQGGEVVILTAEDVESWKVNMKDIDEVWRELVRRRE